MDLCAHQGGPGAGAGPSSSGGAERRRGDGGGGDERSDDALPPAVLLHTYTRDAKLAHAIAQKATNVAYNFLLAACKRFGSLFAAWHRSLFTAWHENKKRLCATVNKPRV